MKVPAKAELSWRIEQLEAELEERRNVGRTLSRFCFNLSRRGSLDDIAKRCAEQLYKEWDAIKRVEVENEHSKALLPGPSARKRQGPHPRGYSSKVVAWGSR
jgi:hypothetical protein